MNKSGRHRPTADKRGKILATAYIGLLFTLHPLILHDGFFDITETKQITFIGITVPFLVFAAVLLLVKPRKKSFVSPENVLFFSLFFLYLVGCVLSGELMASWLGADNRYQGLLSWGLYLAVFLVLSHMQVSPKVLYTAGAAFAAVMLLAVLNHCGADPLGTMDNLIPFDRGRYVSTIGNINFFGAYVCLLLPGFWMLWCGRKSSLYLVLILLGTFGAAAAKSEGTVLGLMAAMLMMPVLMKKSPDTMRRWPLLPVISVVGLQLFRILSLATGGGDLSELMSLIANPIVSAVIILLGLLGFAMVRKEEAPKLLTIRKWYVCGLILAVLGVLLLLLLMNTLFVDKELGVLSRFFVLDSDWGTDRGKVWRACFAHWKDMPFWQKLIGGGSGCLARLDQINPVFPDAILDAAHNEFLHLLLTNGLLGLCLYVAVNASLIYRAFQNGSEIALALSIALIAYLAQSIVNIAQPMTTPLYIAVLSLLAGVVREKGQRL